MQSSLNDKVRLLHIIDAILEIEDYIEDVDIIEFEHNSMMKNACIRQLEIIGEASKSLSKEIRDKNNDIDWKSIIGLRNIIIHQYFGVDEKVVWDILTNDIPNLKIKIQEVIKEIDNC